MHWIRPGQTAARGWLARSRWWLRHSVARHFAVYHTPNQPSDTSWIIERRVKVAPQVSLLKPTWDALREDTVKGLSRSALREKCPEVPPEIVESLFDAFAKEGEDEILYDSMCAYAQLVGDGDGASEDKIHALFQLCDPTGVGSTTLEALAAAVRIVLCARSSSVDVDVQVRNLLAEVEEHTDGDGLSMNEFLEWVQSDKAHATELRAMLTTAVPAGTDEAATWVIPTKAVFEKIKVEHPIVELDGDEMTRIIWQMIKEKLVFPFLDMPIDYYDLSITFRDETGDQVTKDAAKAILEHNVGIKCSTITPDVGRVLEYNLSKQWPSPNRTIRALLEGTVFQVPIIVRSIPQQVPGWQKPIIVGRHAHDDEYEASELAATEPGTFKLVFEPSDGGERQEVTAYSFGQDSRGGVMLGRCNTRRSVENFAKCSFEYALSQGLPLYLSTPSKILKEYESFFTDIFNGMYHSTYKKAFEERQLTFQHQPMDDMVALVMKSRGGFVWACKNYDGDVMSDMVAQGYGSLGMMTCVLVCPDGKTVLTEAAHGTVTKHYRALQRGEKASTNPMASVFAWTRGLAHRAKLDGNERLAQFSQAVEESCVTCIQNGEMSKDLAICVHGEQATPDQWMITEELLSSVANQLRLVLSRTAKSEA